MLEGCIWQNSGSRKLYRTKDLVSSINKLLGKEHKGGYDLLKDWSNIKTKGEVMSLYILIKKNL